MLIFEVIVSDVDRHWWGAYRATLERRFRQDIVLIRAIPHETL